jgi:hypothetical protein
MMALAFLLRHLQAGELMISFSTLFNHGGYMPVRVETIEGCKPCLEILLMCVNPKYFLKNNNQINVNNIVIGPCVFPELPVKTMHCCPQCQNYGHAPCCWVENEQANDTIYLTTFFWSPRRRPGRRSSPYGGRRLQRQVRYNSSTHAAATPGTVVSCNDGDDSSRPKKKVDLDAVSKQLDESLEEDDLLAYLFAPSVAVAEEEEQIT